MGDGDKIETKRNSQLEEALRCEIRVRWLTCVAADLGQSGSFRKSE